MQFAWLVSSILDKALYNMRGNTFINKNALYVYTVRIPNIFVSIELHFFFG
jgi:hypothetical protein